VSKFEKSEDPRNENNITWTTYLKYGLEEGKLHFCFIISLAEKQYKIRKDAIKDYRKRVAVFTGF